MDWQYPYVLVLCKRSSITTSLPVQTGSGTERTLVSVINKHRPIMRDWERAERGSYSNWGKLNPYLKWSPSQGVAWKRTLKIGHVNFFFLKDGLWKIMSKLQERFRCDRWEWTDRNSSITQMNAYILVMFCKNKALALHVLWKRHNRFWTGHQSITEDMTDGMSYWAVAPTNPERMNQ